MKWRASCLITLSAGLTLQSLAWGQTNSPQKPRIPQRGTNLPTRGGLARHSQDEVIVPMIFPVLGKVDWTDTFNIDVIAGKRVHHGEDLMAPKMRPLVAAFNGVVQIFTATTPTGHNRLTLVGDNGYTVKYMHINIDTPGTTDGNGTPDYAFVAGLKNGDRVFAGQLLAWVGNSGNARGGDPHCHFEMYGLEGCINPTASLKMAKRIEAPLVTLIHNEIRPRKGEVRLDGIVRSISEKGTELKLDLLSTTQPDGISTSIIAPKRITIKMTGAKILRATDLQSPKEWSRVSEGMRVVLIGKGDSAEDSVSANVLAYEELNQTNASPPPLEPLPTFAPKKSETPIVAKPNPIPASPPPTLDPPKADPVPFTPKKKPFKFRLSESEQKLFERLNKERKERGLAELTLSLTLSKTARAHAKSMMESNSFSHIGSGASLPDERVRKSGYNALTVRENISMGLMEPDAVLDRWVKQERIYHLNLLDPEIKEVGIGFVEMAQPDTNGNKIPYWTILFANPAK